MNPKFEEYVNNYLSGLEVFEEHPDFEKLEGRNIKRFTRINSDYLIDMFREIKTNSNCSYITYLNDFIRENQGEDFTKPCIEFTSVLVKGVIDGFKYSELASSRLANYMGYPTVYNTAYTDENGIAYIISVDFISKDCEIMSVNDIFEAKVSQELEEDGRTLEDLSLNENYNLLMKFNRLPFGGIALAEWFDKFSDSLDCGVLPNLTNENREQLCRDFVSLYLFRKYALGEIDMTACNIGIIHNKSSNKYSIAPNFDMEATLFNDDFYTYGYFLKDDLCFAMKRYPDIVAEFISRVEATRSYQTLNNIYSDIIDDEERLDHIKEITMYNFRNIINTYNNIPYM